MGSADSAIAALVESRALHRSIAGWQGDLVREALRDGSTWEEVGAALGTTRQAAWARFRREVESEGEVVMKERAEVLDVARNLFREAQVQRREADARWREEQARLRSQLKEGQDRLHEAKRRYATEKRAAREALHRRISELRSASLHQG
jgi:hypothetical protein